MRRGTEKQLRRAVARRAGCEPGYVTTTLCAYCGRGITVSWDGPRDVPEFVGAGGRLAHLDHVIPESRNGPTSLDNTVVACAECNLLKGTRAFGDPEFLQALEDRRSPVGYEEIMEMRERSYEF